MQKRLLKVRRAATSLSITVIRVLLCLTFACFYMSGYTQNEKDDGKIATTFKELIVKNNIANTATKKKCIFKRNRAKNLVTPNTGAGKIYDCIVYTKNAEAIRNRGIIVNSTLPSFITAKATLQQIMQMASMKEVTYIDAPSTDVINH